MARLLGGDCSEGDCGCASETTVLPRGGADSRWLDPIAAAVAATNDRATTSRQIVDRLTAGSGGDRTRATIRHTAGGPRLLWWECCDGSVELAWVGHHDDTMPTSNRRHR